MFIFIKLYILLLSLLFLYFKHYRRKNPFGFGNLMLLIITKRILSNKYVNDKPLEMCLNFIYICQKYAYHVILIQSELCGIPYVLPQLSIVVSI